MPRSRLPRFIALLGLTLFAFVPEGHAQAMLDIGGHAVAVGAERNAVLAELTRFRIHCIGEATAKIEHCNSVLVQGAKAPYDAYANIYFQQDRVKSVRKYWQRGFEGTDPSAFARVLFTVVTQLTKETGQTPTVGTAERRDPGVVQQSIFISAGPRSVEISYAEGLPGADGKPIKPFVTVTEKVE